MYSATSYPEHQHQQPHPVKGSRKLDNYRLLRRNPARELLEKTLMEFESTKLNQENIRPTKHVPPKVVSDLNLQPVDMD